MRALTFLLFLVACVHADDLATVRGRLENEWLANSNPGAAQELLLTQRPDGSWPDINYDDPAETKWPSLQHVERATLLATAWAKPGTDLHHNPAVREATGRAWEFWFARDPINTNWWHNEIGVPRALAPGLLLLHDELTPREKEQGQRILARAEIKGESQNLVWLSEINALRGLLAGDTDLVARAYARIAQEIRTVPSEGLQADMSLLQHRGCLYNHGYGASFAVDGTRLARLLDGTRFALPREKVDLLAAYLLDGSQWMMCGRDADFSARGREIARPGGGATPKRNYLAVAADNLLALQQPPRAGELSDLRRRAEGEPGAPPLAGARHFWKSDFTVFQQPGFYASARMFSDRIANTDFNGPENLLGHHLADGVTTLMTHGEEYRGIFPLWDWQKLPGITARQSPPLKAGAPRRDKGSRGFAGGVSDGQAALTAFDFERDGLVAKKIWFFSDAGMLALGAGISDDADAEVVTTVNQAWHRGEVEQNGEILRHDGLAYTPLAGTKFVHAVEAREGNWRTIHAQESGAPVGGDIFSLWIEHGKNLLDATYAYLVQPTGDAPSPAVTILANTPQLQAAETEDLAAIAFHAPGEIKTRAFGLVAAAQPCLVLLRHPSLREADVSASDPTTNLERLELSVGTHRLDLALPRGDRAGATVTRKIAAPDLAR